MGVTFGIGFFGVGIIVDGILGKEERGERADSVDVSGNFFGAGRFANCRDERFAKFFEALVQAGRGELVEGGNSRAHGERISR